MNELKTLKLNEETFDSFRDQTARAELTKIPAVTGATVGQTVRIAAVDDNGVPTAWEAVDLPDSGGNVDLTVDTLVRKINVFDPSVIVPYKELNLVGAAVESSGAPGYYYVGKQQVHANNKYVFYINGRDVYYNRALFYPDDSVISYKTTNGSLINITEERIGGYICITFTVDTDGYVAICNYVGSDVVDLSNYEFGLSLYRDYDGTYYSTDVYKNSDVFKVQADVAKLKPYRGKVAYVLGDSIMAQNRVTNALADLTGMIIKNYAISGSRLSDIDGTQETAVCYRCEQMSDVLPDIILVQGGTNDAYFSELGTAGESADVSTVAGAVCVIIQKLEAKYPNVPIVFSTMPYRWLDGQQWKSYATVVDDTCKHFGIPVLNAWTSCGFNAYNQSQYCKDDGIHLNDNGGERMAKAWLKVIESAL